MLHVQNFRSVLLTVVFLGNSLSSLLYAGHCYLPQGRSWRAPIAIGRVWTARQQMKTEWSREWQPYDISRREVVGPMV